MKGFANQPSIDALLKALDLPKVPANKLRKALDYNEQQAPPTTSQPERDAREMSRRLQDKSREQQEMRRQQEIPAIDPAYKDTHAEFFAFATAANDAGVAQSTIDLSGLERLLRHYGVTASREKLQQVFAYYQSYGCGYIDLEDFYQLKRQLDLNRSEGGAGWADRFLNGERMRFDPTTPSAEKARAEKARMRTVFDSYDHNSDGYIDSSELEGVLRHYGITASREQMQQVLARYDTTDGRLDFDEFEQLVSDVNANQDEGGAGWADAFLRSSAAFFQSIAQEAGERGGWLSNVFPASSPAAAAAATRLNGSLTDDGALGPISGVMQAPLLDLTSAAKQTDVNDIDMHAYMAVAKAEGLQASGELGGLTVDEAAAVALYTAESAFYRKLNECLRQRDRSALKPFFPYLRLLLQTRDKLPKHTQAVWRGVKGVDLTKDFPKGKKIFWWQFTSTSKNVSTLLNPMFLGTSGTRTQFMIEAFSGIDVQRFSMLDSEAEVLLFPGTQLEVIDVATIAPGLYQVHLKEIAVPMQLFK